MTDSNVVGINITWPSDSVVPSRKCESAVIRVLHRKGEWGRGRDLPQTRIDQIKACCVANSMTLYQALSLRRTLLRSFPNGMKRVTHSSRMGTPQGQNQVSTLFEDAVVAFVSSACSLSLPNVPRKKIFLTESDQLNEMKNGKMARGPTPDILFVRPIRINGRLVKWIDAKLYYASVTFANHKKLPNGKLRKMAQRYNTYFGGEGAFVFGQSYCAGLSQVVTEAMLLDHSPLDLSAVNEFQDNS